MKEYEKTITESVNSILASMNITDTDSVSIDARYLPLVVTSERIFKKGKKVKETDERDVTPCIKIVVSRGIGSDK